MTNESNTPNRQTKENRQKENSTKKNNNKIMQRLATWSAKVLLRQGQQRLLLSTTTNGFTWPPISDDDVKVIQDVESEQLLRYLRRPPGIPSDEARSLLFDRRYPMISTPLFRVKARPWPSDVQLYMRRDGSIVHEYRCVYIVRKDVLGKKAAYRSVLRRRLADTAGEVFETEGVAKCDYAIIALRPALDAPRGELKKELEYACRELRPLILKLRNK
ncbi:hypothetical protein GQ42DRAFT_30895 [Ramicandelaber brevisporus]|nr:hypothetical protein GQ42DRAFT_30895 [Ramicandelaber brevisporus]